MKHLICRYAVAPGVMIIIPGSVRNVWCRLVDSELAEGSGRCSLPNHLRSDGVED